MSIIIPGSPSHYDYYTSDNLNQALGQQLEGNPEEIIYSVGELAKAVNGEEHQLTREGIEKITEYLDQVLKAQKDAVVADPKFQEEQLIALKNFIETTANRILPIIKTPYFNRDSKDESTYLSLRIPGDNVGSQIIVKLPYQEHFADLTLDYIQQHGSVAIASHPDYLEKESTIDFNKLDEQTQEKLFAAMQSHIVDFKLDCRV